MSVKRKVLITGADGFIGSHLTERMVRAGYDVKAFVYYNSFNKWGWLDSCASDVQGQFEVFTGDVRDPYGVKTAMNGSEIVMHLASLIAIPYSYHSPETYVDTNVKGTLNVLQAARELGVSKVVHTSTSEVYGTAQFVPITESHPLQGQSPYSATKIAADQLALSFYRSFDLPVSVIRPFNTYGPRQSARAVIPTIITQLAAGKTAIKLGALEPTRDFNYISDTVKGFIAIAESKAAIGEVINIGSNYEISISETARLISELMDCPLEIQADVERKRPINSEVERLWADNSKAMRILGWKPEYGGHDGLRRGLEETISWFTDTDNLAEYKTEIYNL